VTLLRAAAPHRSRKSRIRSRGSATRKKHPARAAAEGTVAPMRLTDAVSLRSRRRKLRLFLDELGPGPDTSVLDAGADELGFAAVGGCGTLNFFEELYPWPEMITALGLHDGVGFGRRYPNVRYVRGDACALPFPDRSFDLYFSNAVIEHVGGRERQRLLVEEALRVARRVFIATPNRWFPLEVHTRLPLVHWLPEPLTHRIYDLTRKPWAKENHLLGPAELRRLFPVPVRVVNLGLTLVAII
jgi:SAM-dependent methyltransferase